MHLTEALNQVFLTASLPSTSFQSAGDAPSGTAACARNDTRAASNGEQPVLFQVSAASCCHQPLHLLLSSQLALL